MKVILNGYSNMYLLQWISGFPVYPVMHWQTAWWLEALQNALIPQCFLEQASSQVFVFLLQYRWSGQSSSLSHSGPAFGTQLPLESNVYPNSMGQTQFPRSSIISPLSSAHTQWPLSSTLRPLSIGHLIHSSLSFRAVFGGQTHFPSGVLI